MKENGWRILLIKSEAELRYEEGELIINQDDKTQSVPLVQLRSLVIDHPCVKLGAQLINKLISNNTKIVFCDVHHQPFSEVNGYSSHVYTAGSIAKQSVWEDNDKRQLWKSILYNKIKNQYDLLRANHIRESEHMIQYFEHITCDNAVTMEAAAARYYFSCLFGCDFNRKTSSDLNSALNYGYSIILSQTSRSIAAYGYHPALGIGHHSISNPFNFSCDIMEPFRPFVDGYVYAHRTDEFSFVTRKALIELMYTPVLYNGTNTELQTAIDMYVQNCIRNMNHDCDSISEVKMIAA